MMNGASSPSAPSSLTYGGYDRALLLSQRLWKCRIVQLRDHALAFVEHPVQKFDHGLLLAFVFPVRRNQKVRKSRYGVGFLARSIGDGDTEIRLAQLRRRCG